MTTEGANSSPLLVASSRTGEAGSQPSLQWALVFAVPLGLILWATSHPGFDFLKLFIALALLLGVGVTWLVSLILWWRKVERVDGKRWLAAPTLIVSIFILVAGDIPLKARFQVARGEFDAIVAELAPEGSFDEWARLDVPSSVGSYTISSGYQVGENVILYEVVGNFLNDAGFAYLPDGPDERLGNGSFEAPVFRALGGGWYAWIASW